MRYLLDTNICIYLIKKQPPAVLEKFEQFSVGEIGVSSITVAELWFGVQKSRYSSQNQIALEQFLIPLIALDFDHKAAITYGKLRATLETQGAPIGPLDTMIAAHALSLGLTVVTGNEREFRRVSGLKVQNWAE